jgi:hypothetical protein
LCFLARAKRKEDEMKQESGMEVFGILWGGFMTGFISSSAVSPFIRINNEMLEIVWILLMIFLIFSFISRYWNPHKQRSKRELFIWFIFWGILSMYFFTDVNFLWDFSKVRKGDVLCLILFSNLLISFAAFIIAVSRKAWG